MNRNAAHLVLAVFLLGYAGQYVTAAEPGAGATAARLAADTPWKTTAGNSFIAPAGWTVSAHDGATVLATPEPGAYIAVVDVDSDTAEHAVASAWKTYAPDANRKVKDVTPGAARDGWTDLRSYDYQTSPNERRDVQVDVRRANQLWTVTILDLDQAVEEKRAAQISLFFSAFYPKGYVRESFAGRKAHALDAARIEQLKDFLRRAMAATQVPGVSLGLIQDGHVIYSDGLGAKEMGKSDRPDGKTRFMIASNTKALVTLMLAKLVEEKRIAWDTPVIDIFPSFKLGSAETTRKVLVKHLICACTGMPRQDMEWLLNFRDLTPEKAMAVLGTMQPTSGFGELFQYSNAMAAAAGYMTGHVLHPDLELGAAFDKSISDYVFSPLSMNDTTLDFAMARQGDAATPHAPDTDNHMTLAEAKVNLSVIPVRPAGGVWSTTDDMLKYVGMELSGGLLPDGRRYIDKGILLERRQPQVPISAYASYGMALEVDRTYDTVVVHHGGDMIGFHSDMIWLPEQNVGAVILTNGDPGWLIRTIFRRKLLEVLFDGKPEADAQIEAEAKTFYEQRAGERRLNQVPASAAAAQTLASRYSSPELGTITVSHSGARTIFDLGSFSSEVASRSNPDGTTSFITIVPGMDGVEYVAGSKGGRRTLTLRDMQHEYVMVEN